MNPDQQHPTPLETTDLQQPVAYDAQGRPLYAHPPVAEPEVTPQAATPAVVQVVRAISPEKPEVSPESARRHERSQRLYPNLNLSEGEYVISSVRRHPIGLLIPLGLGALLIALTLFVITSYQDIVATLSLTGPLADSNLVTVPLFVFLVLVAIGMFISYYVYTRNRFYLTNESVIQEIQFSLFSQQEQTVSLSNIEDASYTQKNIIQQIFDYGDIRLSTEGDETTYRFSYVAHPKEHIATLNNAVEAFKNGRPVSDE